MKNSVIAALSFLVTRHSKLTTVAQQVAQRASPNRVVILDYPVSSRPRWKPGTPHQRLAAVINREREGYLEHLHAFSDMSSYYSDIPRDPVANDPSVPYWNNRWMPVLDAVALYGFLATRSPRRYIEIGSGHSTMFARRAIIDHALPTRLISIDPHPRAEIDQICDLVIRSPVEETDLSVFDELEPGDVLFVDNSHRVSMNSDVSAVFFDVLPRLRPGVLIHIHDIFIPFDYPESFASRYYSEQYVLGAMLLAADRGNIQTVMPNAFVAEDAELRESISSILDVENVKGLEVSGSSYWFKINWGLG